MFQGLLSSKAGEEDGFRVLGSGWEGLANHLRSGHGCCPSEATTKAIGHEWLCAFASYLFRSKGSFLQETLLSQRSALGLSTSAPECDLKSPKFTVSRCHQTDYVAALHPMMWIVRNQERCRRSREEGEDGIK